MDIYNNNISDNSSPEINNQIQAQRRKKIILIALITLGIILSFVVFLYFFGKKTVENTPPILGGNLPTSPQVVNGTNFYLNDFRNDIPPFNEVIEEDERALTLIWDKPVSGFCNYLATHFSSTTSLTASGTEVIKQEKATATITIFQDRGTGYIYSWNDKTKTHTQISNTRISNVFDAHFGNYCKNILVRYQVNDTEKLHGIFADINSIDTLGNPTPISNKSLITKNIISVNTNSNNSRISYVSIVDNKSNVFEIVNNNFPALQKTIDLKSIEVFYSGNNLFYYEKPSAYMTSSIINVKTGEVFESDLTGMSGKISDDGKFVFGSANSNRGITLFSRDLISGIRKTYQAKTLSEKCALDSSSSVAICGVPKEIPVMKYGYPDDWYMGAVSFDDEVGIFGLNFNNERLYFNFKKETDRIFDIFRPKWSLNSKYFVFINKQDESLWSINTEVAEKSQ